MSERRESMIKAGYVNTTVEARYRRAEAMEQAFLSKTVAVNTGSFPHWIGNGDWFWYERETRTGREYRLVNAAAGTNEPAFDHECLASALARTSDREVSPEDLPLFRVELSLSPTQVEFSALGRRWRFEHRQGTCREIPESPVQGLRSPDGKRAVFVRDHNLWLRDLTSGDERPLTRGGESELAYGRGRSLASPPQAVWSPDSRRLFTLQRDIRGVNSTPTVDHVPQDGSLRPALSCHKVAYPGDEAVETNRLLAIDVATGDVQWADHAPVPLCRLGADFFTDEGFGWWVSDSRRAYFVDVDRGGRRVRVVMFDTATGATRSVLEESDDAGVLLSHNIEDLPLFLPLVDTNELIWFSERTGWAHLYLYKLDTGELLRPLTQGEWVVRDILHFDPARRELYIQTAGSKAGRDPYYRDIRRIHVDNGDSMILGSADCDYVCAQSKSATQRVLSYLGRDVARSRAVSPNGQYVVATRTRVDELPVHVLIDHEGKESLQIDSAELTCDPGAWSWPEPVRVTAADGTTDLHGVVFRPSDYSPEQKYPVLEFVCGVPGVPWVPRGAFVNGPFAGVPYLGAASYAELGFIVVMIEGRGGPHRSRAFRSADHGWLPAGNAFADRIAGLRQLADGDARSMDLSRVGVVGPDGCNGPVYALLEYPEFYSVGAVVGFQDPRLLMASWTESLETTDRQLPVDPRDAEKLVERLQGKLLLIHGMRDTITPPATAFRLVDALQRANKDFSMLMLPNDGHEISSYAQRRIWDYLVEHLLNTEPPREFRLKTGVEMALDRLKHGTG